MAEPEGAGPRSTAGSLRSMAAAALALLQVRLGLLAVEVQEERVRVGALLGWGAAAFFFLGFGSVFLGLMLTVLWWDSHRVVALAVFSAVFLCAGAFAAVTVRRLSRLGSQLFAASLEGLRRDREALQPKVRAP
jgi:uncharacterized membrane protein YqjE